MPKFKFDEYGSKDRYIVRDEDDHVVCVVQTAYIAGKWRLESIGPSRDSGYDASGIGLFADKEIAAHFAWCLVNRVEQIRTTQPLPANVMEYLNRRANELRDQKRRVESELIDLHSERFRLLRLAQQYGVESAAYLTDDADTDSILNKLLTFEVQKGKKTLPLFSEAYLYPLLGKDSARTLLALLRTLTEQIAPDLVLKI